MKHYDLWTVIRGINAIEDVRAREDATFHIAMELHERDPEFQPIDFFIETGNSQRAYNMFLKALEARQQ